VNFKDYFVILSWGVVTSNPFHFFKMEVFLSKKNFQVNFEDYFVILNWGVDTSNPFHFFKMEDFFIKKELSSEL
jgi:hypothetical protein